MCLPLRLCLCASHSLFCTRTCPSPCRLSVLLLLLPPCSLSARRRRKKRCRCPMLTIGHVLGHLPQCIDQQLLQECLVLLLHVLLLHVLLLYVLLLLLLQHHLVLVLQRRSALRTVA